MGSVSEQGTTCAMKGKVVPSDLVRFHVTRPLQRRLEGKRYSFCEDSGCRIVYYTSDGEAFTVDDVRKPPAYKSGDSADLLCFCFGVTGDDLARPPDQIDYIRERVRRQECACDVLNPSGDCCLGSIGRWKKKRHP